MAINEIDIESHLDPINFRRKLQTEIDLKPYELVEVSDFVAQVGS